MVVFALAALGKLTEKTIKIIMLGWLNKLLGVVFSMLKCMLILGFLIIVFNTINAQFDLVSRADLDKSLLYGPIEKIANSVFPYLKELITK